MHSCRTLSFKLAAMVALSAPLAFGQLGIGPITTEVKFAKKHVGHPASTIASGFSAQKLVAGSDPIENPSGAITKFGVLTDGTLTEADENTYLALDSNPGGPVPGYDYGRHFLFQGHENQGNLAYLTRINLDVKDKKHRITLLTPVGAGGLTGFNAVDGSTFNPFTKTILFTQEDGGATLEVNTTWPPNLRTLDGTLGTKGYEGLHPDDQGNLILAEDIGGVSVPVDPNDPNSPKSARQPNSFVYRLVPYDITDLSQGGKLQALQVSIDGSPVVFHADDPSGDVFSINQLRLHSPGTSYPVQWVTVHDTAIDGFAPFDENALAKAVGATPFKRPENLQYLPGSGYQTFFFCPTGDTNSNSGNRTELAQRGAWGSIFRVDLSEDRNSGIISIFVLGTAEQSSFDNLSFADDHTLLAAEDRGDTLHTQLNRLDSIWAYTTDGSEPPLRFLALGRDAIAEVKGDNEPTGLHVSNGSTAPNAQPGTIENLEGARGFFTRQHGQNVVYEIVKVQ
jgi:Bacterial protein of unknown function (DUF839)